MNSSKFEWKVGIFVIIGFVLIAGLMLNFSKGLGFLKPSYQLFVRLPSVAGLKPKAAVMMAGVPIGSVVSADLAPSGTNVLIKLRILSKYKIHRDADFHVDTMGFLGDQYIAIRPMQNQGPVLKNGETVTGVAPFDLQQAVRSTTGLLEQASHTLQNLDQAITNINRTVLSEQTLTNFRDALSNLESVSRSASRMSSSVEQLIDANSASIVSTITNLQSASAKLSQMADDLSETFGTSRGDITATIRDFRETAENLKQISGELQAGKGLAGGVLKDDVMRAQAAAMIANLNQLAVSLHEFSTRLNDQGLWAALKKPKRPATESPPK